MNKGCQDYDNPKQSSKQDQAVSFHPAWLITRGLGATMMHAIAVLFNISWKLVANKIVNGLKAFG